MEITLHGALITPFFPVPAKTFIGSVTKGWAAKTRVRAIDMSFFLTLNLLCIFLSSLKLKIKLILLFLRI